jgi:hypothetical protein
LARRWAFVFCRKELLIRAIIEINWAIKLFKVPDAAFLAKFNILRAHSTCGF